MGLHDPFRYSKHKLWPKERLESNWQFDFWPLKVKNEPDFLVCKWRVTYCWKAFNKGYNFALDLVLIKGLRKKLLGQKVAGVPTLRISGLPFGIPWQNAIWMWASWRSIEYTIRGKVVASPKSGPWWVLWIQVYMWLILTPKMF
jgi:hypothetical protein